ncbi:MAG: translation initiation factor IF-2 [Candidatus Pacearchaeota archaeon]
MADEKLRKAIVTVAGHVDHGKTSILDSFRQSSVQASESGGITQKISFTLFPKEQLMNACSLIEKSGINLKVPGFLFIDTPGHAAFTNLRKRGGSLADIAILVIDINEGIKPQTNEVIQILKHNKTPFIIALNKVDNISGWRTEKETSKSLKERIESQSTNTRQTFDERSLTLIGSLSHLGFEADLFYNISNFTEKIALVPCSAKTKEGIPEILFVLSGLSQKYLEDKLKISKEAKGVLLEIKKDKSINYSEAILYDGILNKNDEIAISDMGGNALINKIRILEEIKPLSNKFQPVEEARAATGLRIQFSEKGDVYPGMPFQAIKGNKEEIEKSFKKEISQSVTSSLEKQGIIAKADSLGSLEALLVLLKQSNIPVVKAGIGKISKSDLISARANLDINELDAIVVGFNVSIDEEAKSLKDEKIKIIIDDVVYKLIENVEEFRKEKSEEIEKKRLMEMSALCKLEIMPKFVFRNTSPAIFGVNIKVGKLISGLNVVNQKGEKVGRIKNIQSENKSVLEASEGQEVAISIPGVNFERQLRDKEFLYSEISERAFKDFRKNKDLLSSKEISLLQEIAEIKRNERSDWGRS